MFESVRPVSLESQPNVAITQRRFVVMTSTGITLAGAAAEAVGIALETFAAQGAGITRTVPVALLDGAKIEVEASAAIAVGANIGVAANGKARTAVTNDPIMGVALTASAADTQIITILSARGSRFSP